MDDKSVSRQWHRHDVQLVLGPGRYIYFAGEEPFLLNG